MTLRQIATILVAFLPLSAISENEFKYSVGAGYGMEFGGAGVKVDYNIVDNLHLVAGLGLTPSAGVKYYLRDYDATWRPKISLHYGAVGFGHVKNEPVLYDDSNPNQSDEVKKEERFFYGPLLSFGQTINLGDEKRNAIEVSLNIPLSDGGKKKWENNHDDDDGYNNHNRYLGNYIYALMPFVSVGYSFHF